MNITASKKHYLWPLALACLFSIYPVIFLWSKNWEDVFIQEIGINISIILVAATLFFACYLKFVKDPIKASLMCCVTNFMFFSFGHIFDYNSLTFIWLKSTLKIWNYNVLIPLWVLIFLFCLFLIKSASNTISSFLFKIQNIITFTLIAFTGISLFFHIANKKNTIQETNFSSAAHLSTKKMPNIYYIILDEYGRQDVLKDLYNYDNTPFIDFLQEQGFFIAEKSCSNYAMTGLSIPSSLSMNFLKIAKEDAGKDYLNSKYSPSKTIENSPLIKILKDHGYFFINVSSGMGFTLRIKSADIEMVKHHLSPFTSYLLDQSFFGPFNRKLSFPIRQNIIFTQLQYLSETPLIQSPHFVFCHILCPHFPFIFDKNGEENSNYEYFFNTNSDYLIPYKHQVQGLNKRIMTSLKDLLKQDPNSIIIIQGDHGPCYADNFHYYCLEQGSFNKQLVKERMGILNAYHFPQENQPFIPNDTTPVNSFRIILNHYLGTTLPLLSNICFWSTLSHPFKFTEYSAEEINKIEIKKSE